MTTTAPTTYLPPAILAAIQPAVDAIVAEVRDAVLTVERARLTRTGQAAVRNNGEEYRPGINAILADALGSTLDGGPTGGCQCPHCEDRGTCTGNCERCDDTSCSQCHPEGCDCDDCPHPEGCRCSDCDDHPDNCRCEQCN